ncbi:MAG: endopeptidase La [Candidatus Lernaella stagnicola]|nr:endopeptidase La [Candidatus Lernaella stagnicola]
MLFSPDDTRPENLPVLALRNATLFPGTIAPMAVGRGFSLRALEAADAEHGLLGVFTQFDPEVEEPTGADIHHIGVVAKILKMADDRRGGKTVLLQGLHRVRIMRFSDLSPTMHVEIDYPDDIEENDAELAAMFTKIKEMAIEVVKKNPALPQEARHFIEEMEKPGMLCDLVASHLSVSVEDKITILETLDVKVRARRITKMLSAEIQMLETKRRIDKQVKGEMDKSQRDYYLRKQLEAIRKELGEDESVEDEIAELRKKMDESELPEEAYKTVDKEIKRLSRIPASSPEYTVAKTYIDTILELPWSRFSEDDLDIKAAELILDEDHYGLVKVKKRILEYLAVRKLKPDVKGPILCLIGPPGVGKTSLGKSVARAMAREFVRMSLGGIHDEAEIRGHRRTYIGALPGRILQGIRKTGVGNPVFMLDELDKIGKDFRGDPSSALLEVLDPEQNDTFMDNYLTIPYNLSTVLFIGTANVADTIPGPLRDRMEIIEIPGYTQEEKKLIARKHLIAEEIENHGLTEEMFRITDGALDVVIDKYTREAGVRNLKRNIAALCRGAAKKIAGGETQQVVVDKRSVPDYLGAERYFPEVAEATKVPGVATGMAWTPTGGDILFIEAALMPGKGKLILTGYLGDVMKESAKAALSYLRSKAKDFGIEQSAFEENDVHIHVPAGAIPKDGPSAGITLLAALASLFTGKTVNNELAMTGEVTLRGQILPVGGIKEKVLAARRAGIKIVILPEKNRRDLEEIPEEIRKGLTLHFIGSIDEALRFALADPKH